MNTRGTDVVATQMTTTTTAFQRAIANDATRIVTAVTETTATVATGTTATGATERIATAKGIATAKEIATAKGIVRGIVSAIPEADTPAVMKMIAPVMWIVTASATRGAMIDAETRAGTSISLAISRGAPSCLCISHKLNQEIKLMSHLSGLLLL